MSPNLLIALRFLTANKRAMILSFSTLVFGVGFFVVTQAQTSGFEEFFIKTILGTNGAIRLEDKIQNTLRTMSAGSVGSVSTFEIQQKEGWKYIEGIEEPNPVMKELRNFANVKGVSQVLHSNALIQSSFKKDSGQIYGINLDEHLAVSDLGKQIIYGNLDDFRGTPSGTLVGRELARRMQLSVGDSYTIEATGQVRRYRVSAIYETGVADIDRVRIYLNMAESRSLLKKPTGASYIQVSVFDRNRTIQDALHMQSVLQYSAKSWQEREKAWLGVFRALRVSSAITVSIFILISGLSMYSNLAMIVMEKTKEIAILRSMGYTRQDIATIFLWLGALVLIAGTVTGWIMGASVTYGLSKVPLNITGIFNTKTFVVAWSLYHYVAATVMAVGVVMAASLIPSRRAARLEPGDVVRGTAQ